MAFRLFLVGCVAVLAAGCMDWGGEPCPAVDVMSTTPVSEADEPEIYAQMRAAAWDSTYEPATGGASSTITAEVVALEVVEEVERAYCGSEEIAAHRARAVVELHTADGTISLRTGGRLTLTEEGGLELSVALEEGDGLRDTDVLPPEGIPQGAVTAKLQISSDGRRHTLHRVVMASSCPDLDRCNSVEEHEVGSWYQPGVRYDIWFEG